MPLSATVVHEIQSVRRVLLCCSIRVLFFLLHTQKKTCFASFETIFFLLLLPSGNARQHVSAIHAYLCFERKKNRVFKLVEKEMWCLSHVRAYTTFRLVQKAMRLYLNMLPPSNVPAPMQYDKPATTTTTTLPSSSTKTPSRGARAGTQ